MERYEEQSGFDKYVAIALVVGLIAGFIIGHSIGYSQMPERCLESTSQTKKIGSYTVVTEICDKIMLE
jgi:hypothetical protein